MTRPHPFLVLALVAPLAAPACSREADEQARTAASEVRAAASRAGDAIADGWVTARVQASYFADDTIKARHIDVDTRDGVVVLEGYVESDEVRRRARQIAERTDGVKRVDDRLLIGQRPADLAASSGAGGQESGAVPTTGSSVPSAPTSGSAPGALDDASITSVIQARYFLHDGVKSRHIDVAASGGVVTLRGEVASDDERAAALLIARTTQGVQRVEDGLTVNAALGGAQNPAAAAPAPEPGNDGPAGTSGARSADETLAGSVTARLNAAKLPDITVTARDGIVMLEGQVANEAARRRAIDAVRTAEGVAQVVDRLQIK